MLFIQGEKNVSKILSWLEKGYIFKESSPETPIIPLNIMVKRQFLISCCKSKYLTRDEKNELIKEFVGEDQDDISI